MCLVQIKQAQIKFPLSGFWTVYDMNHFIQLETETRLAIVAEQEEI